MTFRKKVVGTDTTTYNYDNVGNLRTVILSRVAKKVNGQITKRWLYADGLIPIAELDSAGNIEKRYGPGYIVKNDTTYRVIRDHLGSVRMIVNSQTGEVVQRIDYDAWGNITHLQNPYEFTDIGFAGGLYDQDTGLIRFGARDYDPLTGRWTSKDPILFDAGTSNLYEYALNDPVNNVDLNGLQVVQGSVGVGISAGVFGVGRLEVNIGISLDTDDFGNSKLFASGQASAALGAGGAAYVEAHATGSIIDEQLETGFSTNSFSHTEFAIGAGPVASVTSDVPYNELCPLSIGGVATDGGLGIGKGVAFFGGTGWGGSLNYATPSYDDVF